MNVLSIVTSKGGSGKSTLAAHLAVEALRGSVGSIGLVDTDPQGTLADWHAARGIDDFAFAKSDSKRLKGTLDDLAGRDVSLVIIDTPPSSGKAIETSVAVSDLVLVPVRPSPNDIRAIGATAEIIERSGKPQVFVINGATRGAQLTSQAIAPISRFGPLAPVIIHNRVGFAASMIDGHAAVEIAGGEVGGEEISTLWQYLEGRLPRSQRSREMPLAG